MILLHFATSKIASKTSRDTTHYPKSGKTPSSHILAASASLHTAASKTRQRKVHSMLSARRPCCMVHPGAVERPSKERTLEAAVQVQRYGAGAFRSQNRHMSAHSGSGRTGAAL